MRLAPVMASLLLFTGAVPAVAEPTEVMIRAIAADAKFIGTSMGGMAITLRDARSGEVLATGTTTGGTGNTAAIMDATGRSPARGGADAAGFLATIDIDEPTLVELAVEGPLGRPASAVRAMAQRWIMPGEDVTIGDGWVVEMTGIVITSAVGLSGRTVSLTPQIELLCGCPITPDGPWKASDYAVTASLWQEGARIARTELEFSQSPGGFSGVLWAPAPGRFRLSIHARNRLTGNSGVVSSTVSVTE